MYDTAFSTSYAAFEEDDNLRRELPIIHQLFPIIPYPDYKAAMGHMVSAAQYHKMCRMIGHPGSGKTTLLLEFQKRFPQACYISSPKGCRLKDLIRMLGAEVGYFPPNGTNTAIVRDLIAFLNQRGKDTIFLIDEADNLCPQGRITNIDKMDILRYIWDFTRLHTSFIFAAPYKLEVRLQKSSEQISNSQFYRRCSIHTLKGMPLQVIPDFLHQIESEFHVTFEQSAFSMLVKRISAVERGGLGIVAEILEKCFMISLKNWKEYYSLIELGHPREDALRLFENQENFTSLVTTAVRFFSVKSTGSPTTFWSMALI